MNECVCLCSSNSLFTKTVEQKFVVVVVQSLSRVWPFVTPWTAACRLPCASLSPGVCSNSCPLSQWCHLIISSSVTPSPLAFNLSQHQGLFQWVDSLPSGGQSIGASASVLVLPMNIQDWFPLGLTGLISLQSKGLSRVFSSTAVQKHQFFSAQPALWSNSHIHTTGKNCSFDYTELCQQSNVSSF